jgi:hypothetical protein
MYIKNEQRQATNQSRYRHDVNAQILKRKEDTTMYVIKKNGEYYRSIRTILGKSTTWTDDIEQATLFPSDDCARYAIAERGLLGAKVAPLTYNKSKTQEVCTIGN